jgi:hypothetical protein
MVGSVAQLSYGKDDSDRYSTLRLPWHSGRYGTTTKRRRLVSCTSIVLTLGIVHALGNQNFSSPPLMPHSDSGTGVLQGLWTRMVSFLIKDHTVDALSDAM